MAITQQPGEDWRDRKLIPAKLPVHTAANPSGKTKLQHMNPPLSPLMMAEVGGSSWDTSDSAPLTPLERAI